MRLQADQRLNQNREDFSTTCSSSRTVLIPERTWIDIEPGGQFDQAYPAAKRVNTLLRHGELPREEDGAIEFWRLKDDHRNEFEYSQCWSDDVWKSKMAGGVGNKKRFQYCTDPSGQEILYFRALQCHLGRNPIDRTLQDNVLIPNNVFEYICHIGCAVSLHSVTISGLIAGGQNSSRERQTVLCTAAFKKHQNSTKGPPREEERKKIVAGKGKKREILFPPPTLRCHKAETAKKWSGPKVVWAKSGICPCRIPENS